MLFWESEETIILLDLYEKREFLWNPNLIGYRNPDLKDKAWQEIASNLGREPDDCKRKVESLKSSYRGARNRRIRSGDMNGHHRSFGYETMNRIYKRIIEDAKAKKSSNPNNVKRNLNAVTNKNLNESTTEKRVKAESIDPEESQIVFTFEEDLNMDPMDDVERVNIEDVVNKADDLLINSNKSSENTSKRCLDDCEAFAQYVSAKMRKLSDQQRAIVQHRVSNVFFEVEMSMYSNKE